MYKMFFWKNCLDPVGKTHDKNIVTKLMIFLSNDDKCLIPDDFLRRNDKYLNENLFNVS